MAEPVAIQGGRGAHPCLASREVPERARTGWCLPDSPEQEERARRCRPRTELSRSGTTNPTFRCREVDERQPPVAGGGGRTARRVLGQELLRRSPPRQPRRKPRR